MENNTREYSNGEITVIWEPEKCIHSAICFKGLKGVFDPRRKPWVDMSQADSETIRNQIKQCPSGALNYRENKTV